MRLQFVFLKSKWWLYTRTCTSDVREMTQQPYTSILLEEMATLVWSCTEDGTTAYTTQVYHWDPTSIGGQRRQGRQKKRWKKTCRRDLASAGLTLQAAENIAKEREVWKLTLMAPM